MNSKEKIKNYFDSKFEIYEHFNIPNIYWHIDLLPSNDCSMYPWSITEDKVILYRIWNPNEIFIKFDLSSDKNNREYSDKLMTMCLCKSLLGNIFWLILDNEKKI